MKPFDKGKLIETAVVPPPGQQMAVHAFIKTWEPDEVLTETQNVRYLLEHKSLVTSVSVPIRRLRLQPVKS